MNARSGISITSTSPSSFAIESEKEISSSGILFNVNQHDEHTPIKDVGPKSNFQ